VKLVASAFTKAEQEPLYALTFVWLFFVGPGWVSLDHLIVQLLRRQAPGQH